MTPVRLFFDFLSPYSCLALLRAEAFEREHSIRFELRPVPLFSLLQHNEIKGAGEVPAKRTYVTSDMLRVAEMYGETFVGPPEHPFVSLNALRVAVAFEEDERILALCCAMARACWCDGRSLTDLDELKAIVSSAGFDASDLEDRIMQRSTKKRLRAITEEAIELGLFGVPTFEWEGELFWGQDRMDLLAARVAGRISSPAQRARELLER